MKRIRKNKAPNSLTEHKKKVNADYRNYADKDDLRVSLCHEQRGICCYCMRSIKPDLRFMKIEHFKSQEGYPQLQLDYKNLFGACKGGEGQQRRKQHCDTYKMEDEFRFYPAGSDRAIEQMIWYGNDGTIGSKNNNLDADLNSVLNLNTVHLKGNRKAALDGFKEILSKYKELKRPMLQRWIDDWGGSANNNTLRPYCMVIVFWLQKRLERA